MKDTKKQTIVTVTVIVLTFILSGCVSEGGGWGKIVAQPGKGERVTIQQLTGDFSKYDVYYSGTKPSRAVSVLFCPKEGDTTLTPDRWWRGVKDQANLSNIVSWMHANIEYTDRPTVQLVMGPNSQRFGYVYSFNFLWLNKRWPSYNYVITTRVVSEKELLIYAPVN